MLSPLYRRWLELFVVSALALGTAPLLAAPDEAQLKEAREQFAEGRKLEDEGRFLEALGLFQKVGDVKMTPQVRFHIALCLEATGRLVEALETFQIAKKEAAPSAPVVIKEATDHIVALEKAIPKLTIVLRDVMPEDELTLDGKVIVAQPDLRVDPGPHRLALVRGGKVIREQPLTLEKEKSMQLELSAPPPSSLVPSAQESPKTSPKPPVIVNVTEPSTGHITRIVGFSFLGLSVASLVGLGVSAGLRADRLSALEAECPTLTSCSHDVDPIVEEGQSYTTMVNIFAATTGITAITGGLLLLVAPSARKPKATGMLAVRVEPSFGPGHASIVMGGSF